MVMNEILFADQIQIVIATCTFFAVVIAFYSMRIQHRDRNKEVFCQEAIQCLERAYANLIPEHTNGQPSTARLAWLAAARQLRAYEVLKVQVERTGYMEQQAFIDVCHANEDYWRICLYEAIKPAFMEQVAIGQIQAPQPETVSDANALEPLSVAIVLGYCGMDKFRNKDAASIDIDARIAAIPASFGALKKKFEDKASALKQLAQLDGS